jgi:DNA-binding NtrC family response regulator
MAALDFHTGRTRGLPFLTAGAAFDLKYLRTHFFPEAIGWHRLCKTNFMTCDINKKSVLVVDDDERMLRALDKVLTGEGAAVTCSSWGGGAIEILTEKKTPIDLVIIDLSMPAVSGLTTVNAIHYYYPKLPIIVLTAFGSPEVKAECLREGAVAFLEKPLNSHALIDAIRNVFAREENGSNRSGRMAKGTGEGKSDQGNRN